jgi:hypothetical protein
MNKKDYNKYEFMKKIILIKLHQLILIKYFIYFDRCLFQYTSIKIKLAS